MRTFVSLLFLLFSVAVANAQPIADPELVNASINCVPICGTKYCCVAQVTEVPICNSPFADRLTATPGDMALREQAAAECVDPANSYFDPLPIADISVDALSCKWGCCSNKAVERVFSQAPVYDVALAKLPPDAQVMVADYRQAFLDLAGSPTEADRVLSDVRDHLNTMGICIFCCTF